ncbi:hypothetical protein BKA83DRAFT_670545 [Pisolithus microcarpus]|nr:hypothetical protein BKA83DRAFT_670545 [Pisolithus microcarpus]
MATECLHTFDEKLVPLNLSSPDHPPRLTLSSSRPVSSHCARPSHPSRYVRPRSLRIWNLFKQWSPVLAYGATSLGFLLAIAFWKTEVFGGLDQLSHWLRNDEYFGYCPPLPLYSTLITLSGYTYGPWIGAIISYSAALSGAIVVFSLSPVRAIERKPSLLFLVRLAPYPYNVLNALLAATPTLEMKTYVICTALSLFKVVVHTSIGAGIRSFSTHQAAPDESGWSRVWTAGGIMLCVVLFIYISWVARRAVDDELEDEAEVSASASEERVAFLAVDSSMDEEAELHPYSRLPPSSEDMSEAHLTLSHPISAR